MATENTTTEDWAQRALRGLLEAQLAGESIDVLVEHLLRTCDGEQFPLLHAIKACAMRINAGVDQAIDKDQRLCRTEVVEPTAEKWWEASLKQARADAAAARRAHDERTAKADPVASSGRQVTYEEAENMVSRLVSELGASALSGTPPDKAKAKAKAECRRLIKRVSQ